MKQMGRWLMVLMVGLMVWACADSPTTSKEQGWQFAPGHKGNSVLDSSKIVDTSKVYFAAAGCVYSPTFSEAGAAFVEVPLHGVHHFDCHGLSSDSISKVTLAYHYWIRGLMDDGLHMVSEDFMWDVQVESVPSVPVVCDAGWFDVPANTNYRFIDANGMVTGQGTAGPAGSRVLYYGCGPSLAQLARALSSGWPMTPQPVYNFDELDGGGPPIPPDTTASVQPAIAFVEIAGGAAALEVGSTSAEFVAHAYYADGSEVSGAQFTYTSLNSAVAVNDDGRTFVGVGSGQTTIRASVYDPGPHASGNAVGVTSMQVLGSTTLPDSLCKTSADSVPTLLPGSGENLSFLPSYGPLASQEIVNAFMTLPNNSLQNEAGGWLYYRTSTHSYEFRIKRNIDPNPFCNFSVGEFLQTHPDNDQDLIFVAQAHGHPKQGDKLPPGVTCPDQPGNWLLGVSPQDKIAAASDVITTRTNTNYVVQRDQSGGVHIFIYGFDNGNSTERPTIRFDVAPGVCAVRHN